MQCCRNNLLLPSDFEGVCNCAGLTLIPPVRRKQAGRTITGEFAGRSAIIDYHSRPTAVGQIQEAAINGGIWSSKFRGNAPQEVTDAY